MDSETQPNYEEDKQQLAEGVKEISSSIADDIQNQINVENKKRSDLRDRINKTNAEITSLENDKLKIVTFRPIEGHKYTTHRFRPDTYFEIRQTVPRAGFEVAFGQPNGHAALSKAFVQFGNTPFSIHLFSNKKEAKLVSKAVSIDIGTQFGGTKLHYQVI